jgi:uncharacterized protein (TIGR02996 family)
VTDDVKPVTPAERALLDAVAAAPADDAPRLAYADWVEATDPELAEFIRLDCEHERNSPRGTLRRKSPWLAELESWARSGLNRKGFAPPFVRRGFVEGGVVPSEALARRADALFDRAPALRELTVRPKNEHLEALSRLPHFEQIKRLTIEVFGRVVPYSNGRREPYSKSDVVDDEALALFVASPHLRSLEVLTFACASVGPATARALAESAALADLRLLCIEDDVRFDAAAARALAARPPRQALTGFRIKHAKLGPEGCASLAASALFAYVESLSLEGAGVDAAGARALGRPGVLARCRRLRLNDNALLDDGARGLAEGGGLADLETLDLTKNRIGDAGAAALAGLPGLRGLRELVLTDNVVGNGGARAFASSPHLGRLERLALDQNAIAEAGAEALASTQCLPALKALGLDHNAIFSGETEEWTDWNGSPVGSGPVKLSWAELRRRYGGRFSIF